MILCLHTSRFWRNRRERADGIEILRRAGVSLVATKGPSLDMSTAYGRAMAGLLGEFDTLEVEVKAERQKLANDESARKGKRFTGGPRPFGYEADHVTIRPAEAGAIRWAADALLGGGTVAAVTREWDARGLVSAQGGRRITRQSVTSILRNPRIAGLACLPQRPDPDDRPELADPPRRRRRLLPAEIIGPGDWEGIITVEQWRAVQDLLANPARKPPRGAYSLGGGLCRCSCGNAVSSSVNARGTNVDRCNPQTRADRPGPHCQQMIANVDPHVEKAIIAYLDRESIAELISPVNEVDTAALCAEFESISVRLQQAAEDEALGLISRAEKLAGSAAGRRRQDQISAQLKASAPRSAVASLPAAKAAGKTVRQWWDDLDRARKRAVIAEVAEVIIYPAGRGARVFDKDTVKIRPRRDTPSENPLVTNS